MVQKKVLVENELGLHARPAAMFVQLANKFKSEVGIEKDGQKVNGKSIMGVMMLAAAKGSNIIIRAEGEDAQEAVDSLENLVKEKFGEK